MYLSSKCLYTVLSRLDWKKANLAPVYKKGDNQCLQNYLPVLLLPICSKILKKLIFNKMFKLVNKNILISPKQSGFRPEGLYFNQLLSITHEIHEPLDAGLEVRSVFLDISKAFDKVWYEAVFSRLSENKIPGNLLQFLTDFLKNRKQSKSKWTNIFLD